MTALILTLFAWGIIAGIMLFRRVLPTRRLGTLIAAASALWLFSWFAAGAALAALATVLIGVAALIDSLSLPRVDDVAVHRDLPEATGLGDETAATYQVTTTALREVRFTLHDLPPRDVRIDLFDANRPRPVAQNEPAIIRATVVGLRRGVHRLRPVALRVLGRRQLVQRTLRYDDGVSIRVAPSLSAVRRYRLLALQRRLRELGVRNIRRRGEGTTFNNLREYVIGDDPRHVDWKASARRNRLIVREFTVEQGQTIVLAVDAGRLMTQLSGTFSRFEHALASATVLADVAVHSRDQVGLIVFDDRIRVFVPPMRGAAALTSIREALVGVQPTMTEPDYAAAFRTLAARHRRRSLIVLFTDVLDPRASRSVIALSASAAARHLPLVVALRNDQLVSAAVPTGEQSSRELYVTAAAEELLLAREDALTRMRRAGVSVVDVAPAEMTAAVVNRYLEIKARSSL